MRALLVFGVLLGLAFPASAQEVVTIRGNQLATEISIMRSVLEQVDREFQMRTDEIISLDRRMLQLYREGEQLRKQGAPAPEIEAKASLSRALQADRETKALAYDQDRSRRTQLMMAPVAQKVQAGMQEYLSTRGVKQVFDLDAGQQAPANTPDVSSDFAKWFNARK